MTTQTPAAGNLDFPAARSSMGGAVAGDIAAAIDALSFWASGGARKRVRLADLSNLGPVKNQLARLVMPAGQALIQPLTLPASAKRHLPAIVKNQIGRVTPFQAEATFYGYQRVKSDDPEGVHLSLIVLPKKAAHEAMEQARARGLFVDQIEIDAAPGVNLLPRAEAARPPRADAVRRLMKVNVLLAGALATVVFGGGAIRLAAASDANKRVEPQMREVLAARREVARISAASMALDKALGRAPDIGGALNELAGALGEGAYLERLRLSAAGLEVRGRADSAADALAAIDQSAVFKDASFKSAVVRDMSAGVERFHIAAGYIPTPDTSTSEGNAR